MASLICGKLSSVDEFGFPNGKGASSTPVHVSDSTAPVDEYGLPIFGPDQLEDSFEVAQRYQYAVANIGIFKSVERMEAMLARAGSLGWELVATMDKASNWWSGMEKGFLLLKRAVPTGATPRAWCVTISRIQ